MTGPEARLEPARRAPSLTELLVGGAIVIADNVFHAVPNEVPIPFVLGIASIRLRSRTWRAIGFAVLICSSLGWRTEFAWQAVAS
jgi:hypothetical protein